MTTNDDALLVKALGRTGWQMGCVGIGTLLLGGFMVAMHALSLDPDTANMNIGGIIALYFFGGLFALVGLLMLYVAFIKGPSQNKKLLTVVRESPGRMSHVYGKVIKTRGAENLPGGQHCVCIHLDDGSFYQLLVAAGDMEPLLTYLWQRAPGAVKTAS